VWWVILDRIDAARLGSCADWLSTDERNRLERFAFERDRQVFLLTHAMMRDVLSRYGRCPPREWRFESDSNGKPAIASPRSATGIRYNLSHSQGIAVCALAIERQIGVDVEDIQRTVEFASLATRYFTANEAADVRARSGDEQRRRFFEYWTLKEAVLKAEGAGIVNGLAEFAIEFGADGAIRPTGRAGQRWVLHLELMQQRFAMAIALERGATPMTPRMCEWQPPASA